MRRKILIACAVAVPGVLAVWFLLSPSSVKQPVLDINLQIKEGKDSESPVVAVTFSNKSETMVIYHPVVEVAILNNGSWETNLVSHALGGIGSEIMTLNPGGVSKPFLLTNEIKAEMGRVSARAGLTFTSLSWRGTLAWKSSSSPFLNPVTTWLFGLDRSKRTSAEWSDTVVLPLTLNTNSVP